MATVVKNGVAKMKSVAPKKEVQKKLANEAVGKKETPIASAPKPVIQPETPIINLDDRMQKFEQLQGLAKQRTRLSETLTDINRFKYNQSDSASFFIKDSSGLEFKTTNTNLIHLVTNHLKGTLENRKAEIEKQLIAFEL
jgi:hypothetical protein